MFNKNNLVPIGLIIITCFLAYSTIFDNEFVWDDHVFILENTDIRKISNIPSFFAEDVDGLYRPLRTVHYTLFYQVAQQNPLWYHIQSIVLHTIATILVFYLINLIVKKKVIALIASLLFAVHPIHTERVTNITGSFDLTGIIFLLLALYWYIQGSQLTVNKFKGIAAGLFFIGLLFSEEAIIFPLLVILYEFCFNRSEWKSKDSVKIYVGFFFIAISYIVWRFVFLNIAGRSIEPLGGTLFSTMLTMLKVFVKYIWLLIFPYDLTLFHHMSVADSIFNIYVFGAFMFLLILLLVVSTFYNKIVFFSVGIFFISLAPVSNIVPLQVFLAERYLYVASIGFCLLIAYGLHKMYNATISVDMRNVARFTSVGIFVLMMAFYSYQTVDRNADWQNNFVLWTTEVAKNPGNSKAHDNLGFTYDRQGELDKAITEFETAVELNPENFRAWANLGAAYAQQERYEEAIDALDRSIKIAPYHKTYDKLGLLYARLQREEEALISLELAIALEPRYAKAYNDKGTVLGTIGQFDEARQAFEQAIFLNPSYADAYFNLGVLQDFLGEADSARESFQKAAQLAPENTVYQERAS